MHPACALAALAALAVAAPRAAAPILVPAPRPSLAEPSLSPDRSEIAFVSGGDIWTVRAGGGAAQLLVSHEATESRPLYSPDGARLAFVSTRTGGGDVYVLVLATGELRRVTYDDANDQLDAWSRDGEWLYFSSSSRDVAGMNDVYRVRAAGGTPMAVAGDRYASEFWGAPSPDGRALAITARGVAAAQWWRRGHSHLDESEIAIVRDGANGAPSYTTVEPKGAKHGWPMWSRDGRTLYYMSDRGGAENLVARPVDGGGSARRLTSFTSGRLLWPAISADGRAIVFERDFGIWMLDLATGAAAAVPITLRGAPAGPAVEHVTLTSGLQEVAFAPDGRKAAFVVRGELFATSTKDGGDAARISTTAAPEEQPAWAPDSRRLAYVSARDGEPQLYLYDFASRTERRLTRGPRASLAPVWSRDGALLAYVHDARELRVLTVATGEDRLVTRATFAPLPFGATGGIAFSPDGRWLAYVAPTSDGAFDNVYVVPTAGGTPRQVSWVANASSGSLGWSQDGSYLLMVTGQRTEMRQLARIDLVPRTPRFREDQFRDLFREEPARPVPGQPTPRPPATPTTPASPPRPRSDSAARTDSAAPPADSAARSTAAAVARAERRTEIVFDGIRNRLTLLPVGIDVLAQTPSPDGKQVLLTALVAGQTNLYVYPLDELQPGEPVARQLTSTPGAKQGARWSPDGKEVYYLDAGRLSAVTVESRAVRAIPVSAEMDVDFARERQEVLGQAWRYLRDNFYDEKMNGVDWTAARAEYATRIEGARTRDEMRRILGLLIGELNASHTGVGAPPAAPPSTGRVGLRFDRAEYERAGRLRVSEVTPLSPAAVAGIAAGQYLVSVEGIPVGRATNLDSLLAYRVNRRTALGIAASGGAVREVVVRPVTRDAEKGLIYRGWVEARRAYVAKQSNGRLGYVHMFDMSANALAQLHQDLDAENFGREGVVVDVRNNNGGFVNVYAIDVFSRRPYLRMESRRLPAVSARTQLGQRSLERPTVLVTNQHSLSDAEDFTEGYRTLGLGKVVGEPTSGWIIYTSNVTLLDGTTLRLPGTRIYGADGKDMEMNPRPVDVAVLRPMGESYTGRDVQLDAAVKQLLGQLAVARTAAGPAGR